MQLWIHWLSAVSLLRPACSRLRTFLWLTVCLSGISIRPDIFGVTSIVRAFGLKDTCYDRLLDFFHSPALNSAELTGLWVKTVLNIFPGKLTVQEKLLVVGDGLKVPKSGKKMPAVKRLHQSSDSNTKPQYIMGHSCQAVALLVGAQQSVFAVPLASRIHEGLVFSNRDTKTLLDKMMLLVDSLGLPHFYFIADAYYSARKVMVALLGKGNHLVSQVRTNAVAYLPAATTTERRKKGRPKMYADKIRLKTLFDFPDSMITAESPVYGGKGVQIRYRCADLLIKRIGILVRFLAVLHPVRGRCILMCTDLSLPAIEVIKLYGLRFKIEVSFKQALRTIGSYAYHFWMKGMTPLGRSSGDQYLHRKSESYRNSVKRKLAAYHRFIQIGLIAQGLLQFLSVSFPELVWANFGSWIRTIRPGVPPSEYVTSVAMKNSFPDFLAGSSQESTFTKFIAQRIDFSKNKTLGLAA
ncbi:MAG: transposase [Deltaproteobacteria bacterium]